jgi:hypothetical protein
MSKAAQKFHGLRQDVLFVRRESKPAENEAQRKKGHFRMELAVGRNLIRNFADKFLDFILFLDRNELWHNDKL